MKITIYTSPQTAALNGLPEYGVRTVEVDAASLTAPERQVLARLLDDKGVLKRAFDTAKGSERWGTYNNDRPDVTDPIAYVRSVAQELTAADARIAAEREQVALFVAALQPDAIDVIDDRYSGGQHYYGLSRQARDLCPPWDGTLPAEHPVALEIKRRNEELQRRAEALAEDVPASELVTLRSNGLGDARSEITVQVDGMTRRVRLSPAMRERAAAEVDRLRAERDRRDAEAEAARDAWIEQHGSARLRRCRDEGIECQSIFRDEYMAREYPDWILYSRTPWEGDSTEARNPRDCAFALLDRARESCPDATLWYYSDKANGRAGYCAEAEVTFPGDDKPTRIALLDDDCAWDLGD